MCDLNGTQHKKYKIIKVVKWMYTWNIGIAFPCKLIYTGKHRGQLQYKHFFNVLCCMLLTILWPIDSMLWPLYNNIQIQWYDLIWQRVVHSAREFNILCQRAWINYFMINTNLDSDYSYYTPNSDISE